VVVLLVVTASFAVVVLVVVTVAILVAALFAAIVLGGLFGFRLVGLVLVVASAPGVTGLEIDHVAIFGRHHLKSTPRGTLRVELVTFLRWLPGPAEITR
jgi:fatty acid desaturase